MTEKQKRLIAPKVMEIYNLKDDEKFRIVEYVLVDLKFKDNTLFLWNELEKKWVKDDGTMWDMLLKEESICKI